MALKLVKWLAIAAAITALASGCSLRTLIVEHLDWLLMRELDNYFDLTDEQYRIYKQRGKGHMKWFQETQIPWLLTEIEFIRSHDKPVPRQHLQRISNKVLNKLWINLADRLAADGGHLFRSLSTQQYRHFDEKILADADKMLELSKLAKQDYPAAYEEIQAAMIDEIENWVGAVSPKQQQLIKQITFVEQTKYKKEVAIWLEIRKEFLRRLKLLKTPQEVAEFLKRWARDPDIERNKYQQYRKNRISRQIAVWTAMEKTVTPEQIAFRNQRLSQLKTDLSNIQKTKY